MSGVGGVGRTIGIALQDVASGGGQGNGKTPIHTEGQGGDGTRGTHGNQDGGRAWGANGRGPADLSAVTVTTRRTRRPIFLAAISRQLRISAAVPCQIIFGAAPRQISAATLLWRIQHPPSQACSLDKQSAVRDNLNPLKARPFGADPVLRRLARWVTRFLDCASRLARPTGKPPTSFNTPSKCRVKPRSPPRTCTIACTNRG